MRRQRGFRPNASRNFTFYGFKFSFSYCAQVLAGPIYLNVTIDIAERNGEDFSRSLCSAERFKDRAILVGSSLLKISLSRSMASLSCVTSAVHLRSFVFVLLSPLARIHF